MFKAIGKIIISGHTFSEDKSLIKIPTDALIMIGAKCVNKR